MNIVVHFANPVLREIKLNHMGGIHLDRLFHPYTRSERIAAKQVSSAVGHIMNGQVYEKYAEESDGKAAMLEDHARALGSGRSADKTLKEAKRARIKATVYRIRAVGGEVPQKLLDQMADEENGAGNGTEAEDLASGYIGGIM